jgi:predicted permease
MPAKRTPRPTPAWLFRFFDFLRRIPFPLGLLALLIFIGGGIAMHLEAWRLGLVPRGQINSYLATISLYNVGYLGAWMWLDSRARVALTAFFRYQGKSQAQVDAAFNDFVSVRPVLAEIMLIGGSIMGYLTMLQFREFQPLIGKVFPLWDLVSWVPVSGFTILMLFRTLRQAFLMTRYFEDLDLDIFNPAPVYAVSRYSSQASVTLLVINYALLYASVPDLLLSRYAFVFHGLIMGVSLIYFFVPLASINQRMRAAKSALLAELGGDIKRVYQHVHSGVTRQRFAQVNSLRTSVGALKDELEIVQKIPTWPWQPDTLRNLLTPLLLPIVIYLSQRYVGTFFGF